MLRQIVIAAGVLLFAAQAAALDLPTRKAGLWEINMMFASRILPAQTMKQCIVCGERQGDERQFRRLDAGDLFQARHAERRQHHAVDSVCKFGAATTTSHVVMTGSFDSTYSVDVTSTRSGGVMAPVRPPARRRAGRRPTA